MITILSIAAVFFRFIAMTYLFLFACFIPPPKGAEPEMLEIDFWIAFLVTSAILFAFEFFLSRKQKDSSFFTIVMSGIDFLFSLPLIALAIFTLTILVNLDRLIFVICVAAFRVGYLLLRRRK